MKPLSDSIRAAKTAFFGLVKDASASDSLINAAEQKIRNLQTQADKLTFDHFRKVRNIFTPDQQKKFDDFVQKMMQRPGPGGWRRDSTHKQGSPQE
jgi:Spy/CpxP family protein refolding chaperone